MPTDLVAALSFSLISIFTPGPNNVSSAAMGALYGFRQTRKYILGMVAGFFLILLVCATVAATVLALFPGAETALRYVGAAYTLYLAYAVLKASYGFDGENAKPFGFMNGFLLQLFNPKGIVFGLTLFSTYFASMVTHPATLILVVFGLASMGLCATSLWAGFGSFIQRYTQNPRARMALNICLSGFLVLTALDLAGII
jgi:cysteine/O-acetylserine efflux protein